MIEYWPILIISCCFTLFYVIRKIRKSQMQIEDTVFWIALTIFLLILGIVPQISSWLARLLGFESPSNMIFLLVIFLLLIKLFAQSVQLSQLESKVKELTQKIALKNFDVDKELENRPDFSVRQEGEKASNHEG